MRQVDIIIRSHWKTIERETKLQTNLAAYTAWRMAGFMRTKTLPKKPDDLLKQDENKSGNNWKDQKRMIEHMNLAMGGFDNRKGD